ncbi:MAG: hypothetical protein H7Y08_01900 [Rhizobiaceae bacterium]|nr:hypothetical protein [Rhizobiaceae bacterium]
MGRLILALAVGLLGAAVVHIAVIFAIPALAGNNAWARLGRLGDMNAVVRLDALRSEATDGTEPASDRLRTDFAFVDPGFVTAGCRFSLAEGPVRLAAGQRTEFWSASIYSRRGDNLYSINDRSAVEGQFDLLVGTADQLVEARANSADRDETAIPVTIASVEAYLTLRALVDEESKRPGVDAFVSSVTCEPVEEPSAGISPSRES